MCGSHRFFNGEISPKLKKKLKKFKKKKKSFQSPKVTTKKRIKITIFIFWFSLCRQTDRRMIKFYFFKFLI